MLYVALMVTYRSCHADMRNIDCLKKYSWFTVIHIFKPLSFNNIILFKVKPFCLKIFFSSYD